MDGQNHNQIKDQEPQRDDDLVLIPVGDSVEAACFRAAAEEASRMKRAKTEAALARDKRTLHRDKSRKLANIGQAVVQIDLIPNNEAPQAS